jgi:hypothetical protein
MREKRYLLGGIGVLVVLAGLAATTYADDLAAALAAVQVVPRQNQWMLVESQQRAVLKKVVQMSAAERDRPLKSADARFRGIGIFIAEQQGDLPTLLGLSNLLTDEAVTVPFAAPVAQVGEFRTREQTVADYLTSVYLEWFGVDVDQSKERFDEALGPVKDAPQNLVQPWIVRLRRARSDERAVAEIKAEISKLPEETRWAVVTLGYNSSLYTKAEARSLLAGLSDKTREMLRAHATLPANEPLFHSPSFRDAVLEQYAALAKP